MNNLKSQSVSTRKEGRRYMVFKMKKPKIENKEMTVIPSRCVNISPFNIFYHNKIKQMKTNIFFSYVFRIIPIYHSFEVPHISPLSIFPNTVTLTILYAVLNDHNPDSNQPYPRFNP